MNQPLRWVDNYGDFGCHFGWQLQSPKQMSDERRLFTLLLPLKLCVLGCLGNLGKKECIGGL